MSYYETRPCDIKKFREQTERGVSSSGINMDRKCSKCGKKIALDKAKRTGFGSRFDPVKWSCKDGCNGAN